MDKTLKQEGHDGPYIAHLNIITLNDMEQVILYTITNADIKSKS
jgi:hypothetical protein